MSMSQEEIEALMNGLELTEEEKAEEPEAPAEEENSDDAAMSEDDIAQLIASTSNEEAAAAEADIKAEPTPEPESKSDESVTDSDTEQADLGDIAETLAKDDVKDDITDVLNEIENMPEEETPSEEVSEISMDEELVSMDDVSTDELEEELEGDNAEDDSDFDEKAKTWTSNKINKGEFPLPVEPNTKVVSQLNEVNNDSEEKASQIFDALSFILDENDAITKNKKDIDNFLDKEIELLNSLVKKFPNIAIFKERLEEAENMKAVTADIASKVDGENMKVFQAMELMQFHDINRQKIERVMSVIRKLSTYLNNLFEEEGDVPEIAVAKYIHGDNDSDLVGTDDLDALIEEFNK